MFAMKIQPQSGPITVGVPMSVSWIRDISETKFEKFTLKLALNSDPDGSGPTVDVDNSNGQTSGQVSLTPQAAGSSQVFALPFGQTSGSQLSGGPSFNVLAAPAGSGGNGGNNGGSSQISTLPSPPSPPAGATGIGLNSPILASSTSPIFSSAKTIYFGTPSGNFYPASISSSSTQGTLSSSPSVNPSNFPEPPNASSSPSSGHKTGTLIGAIIGSLAFLVTLLVFFTFYIRRRRQRRGIQRLRDSDYTSSDTTSSIHFQPEMMFKPRNGVLITDPNSINSPYKGPWAEDVIAKARAGGADAWVSFTSDNKDSKGPSAKSSVVDSDEGSRITRLDNRASFHAPGTYPEQTGSPTRSSANADSGSVPGGGNTSSSAVAIELATRAHADIPTDIEAGTDDGHDPFADPYTGIMHAISISPSPSNRNTSNSQAGSISQSLRFPSSVDGRWSGISDSTIGPGLGRRVPSIPRDSVTPSSMTSMELRDLSPTPTQSTFLHPHYNPTTASSPKQAVAGLSLFKDLFRRQFPQSDVGDPGRQSHIISLQDALNLHHQLADGKSSEGGTWEGTMSESAVASEEGPGLVSK